MNYVFFGSPKFASIILNKLVRFNFAPTAIVCNPDKPVGRKQIITPPPTKILAEKYKINILQPEILATYNLQLTNYKPDFFIVAAYSKILPEEILEIPRLGTIGVHPSLLPKYRGASPIQSAIINGETETGVSLYLMDAGMDSGPILKTGNLEIDKSDNYESLMKKLAGLGADLLIETLPKFSAGKIMPLKQNHEQATFTKKFKTEDGFIEYNDLEEAVKQNKDMAIKLHDKIRGLYPEPGAWTLKNGKRMKILESELAEGKLKLKMVQFEGKKPQTS